MFFKSKLSQRERDIEKINRQIKLNNKTYYSVILKGETIPRIIEDNLIHSKEEINQDIQNTFLNQKRENSSTSINIEKAKKLKKFKEIIIKKEKIKDNNETSTGRISYTMKKKYKSEKKNFVQKYQIKNNLNEKDFTLNEDYYDTKMTNNDVNVDAEKGELGVDEPLEIVNVGRMNRTDKTLYCEIKWKMSKNGIQKDNTIIKTSDFLLFYPKLLINYYESKIIFMQELFNN